MILPSPNVSLSDGAFDIPTSPSSPGLPDTPPKPPLLKNCFPILSAGILPGKDCCTQDGFTLLGILFSKTSDGRVSSVVVSPIPPAPPESGIRLSPRTSKLSLSPVINPVNVGSV